MLFCRKWSRTPAFVRISVFHSRSSSWILFWQIGPIPTKNEVAFRRHRPCNGHWTWNLGSSHHSVNWGIFNFTFVGILLDDLAKINRAWLYNDLKVSDSQANAKLSQPEVSEGRTQEVQASIPTEGYFIFCWNLIHKWQICQNKVHDEQLDWIKKKYFEAFWYIMIWKPKGKNAFVTFFPQ